MENKLALLVPHASIPKSISAPFAAAGAKFTADYDRYCAWLVLLPELMKENPNRETLAAGFSLPMVKDVSDELKADFLANAPEELNFQTTIFLHPLDENGLLMGKHFLNWSLSALIGQAKVGQLVIAKGLSLSDAGFEAFVLLYQREMMSVLIAREYGDLHYRGACSYFIHGLNANIAHFREMRQQEMELVENLEIFGTADKNL